MALPPDPVSVADACARGLSFEGQFAIETLPRTSALVAAAVADSAGGDAVETDIAASIVFVPARAPATAALNVEVRGQIGLLCQRCLELMPVMLDQRSEFLMTSTATSDEALAESGQSGERWDHDVDDLALAELVDEVIVLSLPMVVRHSDIADCGPLANRGSEGENKNNQQTETQTPFAGLAALMKQREDS
ncbi:MAG: YceD family protein [Pseudomonadota bacterium]